MSILPFSAPRAPRIGSIDHVPNLLSGLLSLSSLVAQPPGKQLFDSAPPRKFPVTLTLDPSYLALGVLLSNQKPFTSPKLNDVPKTKFEVQADFYVTSYTPGQIAGPEPGNAVMFTAPRLKLQVFAEPPPNTLIWGIPAPLGPPIGKTQDFSQLQSKSNVWDVNALWPNSQIRSIPGVQAQPPGKQLVITLALKKYDVWDVNYLWPSNQFPNSIPLGLPIPDLTNYSPAAADALLTSIGFVRGVGPSKISATVPAGFIADQGPSPGAFGILGTVVVYYVSLGPAPIIPTTPTGVYVGRVVMAPKAQGVTELTNPPFDFISSLSAGETISTAVVTATVYSGVDSNPSGIISGTATISGTKVLQYLTSGVVGTIYSLVCTITTSKGQRLKQSAFFVIKPDSV